MRRRSLRRERPADHSPQEPQEAPPCVALLRPGSAQVHSRTLHNLLRVRRLDLRRRIKVRVRLIFLKHSRLLVDLEGQGYNDSTFRYVISPRCRAP